MNEVVKLLGGDQLYREYERGRGEERIFSSNTTYALQHGIHEAGVAMIDEARREICVLFTFPFFFDGLEELLVDSLLMSEHGQRPRMIIAERGSRSDRSNLVACFGHGCQWPSPRSRL